MKTNNKIENVALYKYIDNNQEYSIEEGIVPLFDWCYENDKTIYNLYIDTEYKRIFLDELIDDAKVGKFKTVIVDTIQSFGNIRKDIRSVVYTLNSYNVEVKEIREQ